MPSISTQTTTFLPAVVSVLKSHRLPKRFLTRMMRKHGKEVKQTNTHRANFLRDVAANKKALLKILKDMTLTVRKNNVEAAKSQREAAKVSKAAVQEQKKIDADVKKFSKELKKAAKEEAKTDKKAAKKAEKKATKKAAKKIPKVIQESREQSVNTWDIMFNSIC